MIRVLAAATLLALVAPATGAAAPADPRAGKAPAGSWKEARSIFEARCAVCHGCYDAPCQLKLGTWEGIERGATLQKVYDASRLEEAPLTRLGIDAHGAAEWRLKGFHSVLAEGPGADPRSSLIVRMLELKRDHPLLVTTDIGAGFTLDLNRKETCAADADFNAFAKDHPMWGMPYALAGLEPREEAVLVAWVRAGAPHEAPPPLPPALEASIADWERFLNAPALKNQLAARYIYEHLFLASIYFRGIDDRAFFRLVRSRTPEGKPIEEIATRRPFDDPQIARVYYRFLRRDAAPLEKTHMPYPLDRERLRLYKELFLDAPYAVDALPGYSPEIAANPFRAFAAIPARSRYRFLLEEAQFTMMGFIKGPVCRGQVALDVIEDRFWVTFMSPDVPWMKDEDAFLAGLKSTLDMPAEAGSSPLPTIWARYAVDHPIYVRKKSEFLEKATRDGHGVTLNLLWDGDGTNPNAALTVFRHFDSATVAKGLIGTQPKTSWVVDYPLLERIHYLLVAGFDVFGNVDHQISTRLYMDFLRMEGEANFLMLLPTSRRAELADYWYRGVSGVPRKYITHQLVGFQGEPNIAYRTRTPEAELYPMIEARMAPVEVHDFDPARVADAALRADLKRLAATPGAAATWMPEISFVTVRSEGGHRSPFTILRDSAHTNVASLFREDARRLRAEDELTAVPGYLGAYPNALFEVPARDLELFVGEVGRLDGPGAYARLRTRFGILRASEGFWRYSDEINADHDAREPIDGGRFDFNRLEAY